MKKLLALVLALVMSLGLATVGANAADFTDDADITYKQAVDVLSMAGVLAGYEDGSYKPQAELDRAAGAKIIAYLDLGEEAAETLPAVSTFDDVPASNWASKYIAYCVSAGYVNGTSATTYSPSGKLTGYAFGKMLLGALGYDVQIEGLDGSTWATNVAKLLDKNGIGVGVSKAGSAVLTREEAAQYAFKALDATCVQYANKGTTVSGNGIDVSIGATAAAPMATNAVYTDVQGWAVFGTTAGTVQLAEKIFKGDLRKNTGAVDDDMTPATEWSYNNGKAIETVMARKTPILTLTEGAANDAAVVAKLSAAGYKFPAVGNTAGTVYDVYQNGADVPVAANLQGATNAAKLTADGVTTVFYGDSDTYEVTDVLISWEKIEKLASRNIHAANATAAKPRYITLGGTENYITDDFAADDYIVYSWTENSAVRTATTQNLTRVTVTNAALAQTVSGKVGSISAAADQAYVVVDGTKYSYAYENDIDAVVSVGSSYNFYLDSMGNVMTASVIDESAPTNVVYISAYEIKGDSSLGGGTYSVKADAIFGDGTAKIITLATTKSGDETKAKLPGASTAYTVANDVITGQAGTGTMLYPVAYWFGYTDNGDGTYTLKDLSTKTAYQATTGQTFTKGDSKTIGTYFNTADTKFMVKDANGTTSTFTGYTTRNLTLATSAASAPILVTHAMNSSKAAGIYAVNQAGQAANAGALVYAFVMRYEADLGDGYYQWAAAVDGQQGLYKTQYPDTPSYKGVYTVKLDTDTAVEDDYKFASCAGSASTAGAYMGVVDTVVDSSRIVINLFSGFANDKGTYLAGTTAASYNLTADAGVYTMDNYDNAADGSAKDASADLGKAIALTDLKKGDSVVYVTDEEDKIIKIWVTDYNY